MADRRTHPHGTGRGRISIGFDRDWTSEDTGRRDQGASRQIEGAPGAGRAGYVSHRSFPNTTAGSNARSQRPQAQPVRLLGLSGLPIDLEAARSYEDWYDTLHPQHRREVGFWRPEMERDSPLPSTPASVYRYQHFVSHPRIIGIEEPILRPSRRVVEGISPEDRHDLIHGLQEEFRKLKLAPGSGGQAPPVPNETVQRLRDVDVALQQLNAEHDRKILPLVQPTFETPITKKFEQGRHLSPYAGSAPARNDPSYLGQPFAQYRPPPPQLQYNVPEHPSIQHVMDMLQSTALVVNPNASNRSIGSPTNANEDPPYENEDPIPRATPIHFSHFSNPDQGLTPSSTYFSSRFLAPVRHEHGPQGLGPYYAHRSETLAYGVASEAGDGPLWLGRDEVRAARHPWPALPPAPEVMPRARRARATDRTNYTRRRAPNKKPRVDANADADNSQTAPVARGGSGRGRRGSTGRPRGRPRGSRSQR